MTDQVYLLMEIFYEVDEISSDRIRKDYMQVHPEKYQSIIQTIVHKELIKHLLGDNLLEETKSDTYRITDSGRHLFKKEGIPKRKRRKKLEVIEHGKYLAAKYWVIPILISLGSLILAGLSWSDARQSKRQVIELKIELIELKNNKIQ